MPPPLWHKQNKIWPSTSHIKQDMRRYIRFLLTAGILLLLVLIVSGSLWWLLTAVGDRGAAQGAKGVAMVALVCWVFDFVALVVLLAVANLDSIKESDE
jgi:peptidoglycan biosynthesis protein MviN/MurJ (putative lipid II flippase)